MDPKRTREALADLRTALEFPTPKVAETSVYLIMPDHILDFIKEFARRWVDVFEECENCKGRGFYVERQHGMSGEFPCESCKGRGFSLNQERLERAAASLFNDGRNPARLKLSEASAALQEKYRHMAEAAILAFLLEGPNGD